MRTLLAFALLLIGLYATAQAQTTLPEFKLTGHSLVLPAPLAFKPGTAELTPGSTAGLEHIKKYLEQKTYISLLRLEGHVAEKAATDQALSEQRAQAVAAWLVAHGVECRRLLPVGFGSTKPAGTTPEANTRIEAVNTALRDRPIGGLPVDGGGRVVDAACKP
ncbi:hypothetical protein GCM10023185_25150 [Hymenobacter saemangeumensis]|uniref:OmpA-like domain-containing protein n=1 Tax=Hymenobacter saemangeumensis TaxID=1084522 RepID=A0ABP8IHG2_9BACT